MVRSVRSVAESIARWFTTLCYSLPYSTKARVISFNVTFRRKRKLVNKRDFKSDVSTSGVLFLSVNESSRVVWIHSGREGTCDTIRGQDEEVSSNLFSVRRTLESTKKNWIDNKGSNSLTGLSDSYSNAGTLQLGQVIDNKHKRERACYVSKI